MKFNDEIKKEYLKITEKKDVSEISEKVNSIIEQQSCFFESNTELFEQYKDMLSNYNYYTRKRIAQFLLENVEKEERFIFTSLNREEERPESSSIIYPILYSVRQNSKAESFLKLTTELFENVIKYKEEMNTYQSLYNECGPSKYLEKEYNQIRDQARAQNIQRIETLEKIIIFEDFVGTGTTLIEDFLKESSVLKQLNSLKELGIRIVFLILEISEVAEQKLVEFLNDYGFNGFIEYKVPVDTRAFKSYKGNYKMLSEKLDIPDSKYSLRALVSTYLETPNNTIALFWSNKSNYWLPLFPRSDKFIVYNEEAIENLQKKLEKYDFRKSAGIGAFKEGILKLSPKVNLMVLVLLKYLKKDEAWDTVRNIISKVFGISNHEAAEIISTLEHANFIEYNDEMSEVKLTRAGRRTISGVRKIPNISEFIDESVL